MNINFPIVARFTNTKTKESADYSMKELIIQPDQCTKNSLIKWDDDDVVCDIGFKNLKDKNGKIIFNNDVVELDDELIVGVQSVRRLSTVSFDDEANLLFLGRSYAESYKDVPVTVNISQLLTVVGNANFEEDRNKSTSQEALCNFIEVLENMSNEKLASMFDADIEQADAIREQLKGSVEVFDTDNEPEETE